MLSVMVLASVRLLRVVVLPLFAAALRVVRSLLLRYVYGDY